MEKIIALTFLFGILLFIISTIIIAFKVSILLGFTVLSVEMIFFSGLFMKIIVGNKNE